MRWLLLIGLLLSGCSDSPPPTYGGGAGAVPGGSIPDPGGTGGNGGAGGSGGEGGDGGSMGACDNATDIGAMEAAGESLRDVARSCGLPNNMSSFCASLIGTGGLYEECISDCVEESVPGLSTECAACYGALERCGLASLCRTSCQLNNCSSLCLDCLNRGGCIEEYETCRGLPGDSCPK
ncbi:MAG: hypothetical protein ACN4G0_06640 [Polyangiales bacterium]